MCENLTAFLFCQKTGKAKPIDEKAVGSHIKTWRKQ